MTTDERRELSDLLARLADGDRDAFGPAFARLWPRVRGFAGRVLKSEDDADDAAQRAMLAVFSRASEYDRERDGLAWSLGVTWWECRTLLRAATRRREVTLDHDDRIGEAPSPEEALLDAELRDALLDVLGELSALDRHALGLDELGEPVAKATLRKRRQRALARLRNTWSRNHGQR
jgi:RNA polymerase sigma factor (sigma-70 family)